MYTIMLMEFMEEHQMFGAWIQRQLKDDEKKFADSVKNAGGGYTQNLQLSSQNMNARMTINAH